ADLLQRIGQRLGQGKELVGARQRRPFDAHVERCRRILRFDVHFPAGRANDYNAVARRREALLASGRRQIAKKADGRGVAEINPAPRQSPSHANGRFFIANQYRLDAFGLGCILATEKSGIAPAVCGARDDLANLAPFPIGDGQSIARLYFQDERAAARNSVTFRSLWQGWEARPIHDAGPRRRAGALRVLKAFVEAVHQVEANAKGLGKQWYEIGLDWCTSG